MTRVSISRRAGHGLLATLALALLNAGCQQAQMPPEDSTGLSNLPADTRTPIVLPAAARTLILGEMRIMLGSLSQFLIAASTNDTATMASAATAAGIKAAVDVDPRVSALLPAEFLEIGEGTHVSFDSLAISASRGDSQDVLLRQLSAILGRCVACHGTYRLVTDTTGGR